MTTTPRTPPPSPTGTAAGGTAPTSRCSSPPSDTLAGAFARRAELAREFGDDALAETWTTRAAGLKRQFNERFWLPDRGWYAVALDRDKSPVDACTSNIGHCLWSGIVDADKAPIVAERLLSPEMFTGWGVRTLGATMGAYDPVSYHNGSVWPHDNALIVAGLMRYGFVEEAQRIAQALFAAAESFGGRLPELFCAFDRAEYPEPVPYPTSCSPQAWAAGAPVLLMRALLRFDAWVPGGMLWLAPVLPAGFAPLRIEGVSLGDAKVSLTVSEQGTSLDGVPAGVKVLPEPKPPV